MREGQSGQLHQEPSGAPLRAPGQNPGPDRRLWGHRQPGLRAGRESGHEGGAYQPEPQAQRTATGGASEDQRLCEPALPFECRDQAPDQQGDTLKLMKPTAYLINTGRGSLIKEDDLIEVLHNKGIAGAGLDVQETEPPTEDNPLYHLENVILTPHIGWKRLETRQRLMDIVADNLASFLQGAPATWKLAALGEKAAAVAYLKNTLLEILECHDKDNDRQIHRDEFELLMRNPEMHFVLTRFGVNVTDLINLRDVLFEEKSENDDEEEEEDLDTNSPLPSARRLRKLSFQEFLEVVLRLRGGNSATVTDIVDLREYVRQRFDRMDVRFHHAALSGSPVPLSRLRTMKSMPTRRHPLPHAPAQVEEEPPTPAQLPRLLGEDPETPKTPKRVQLDDRLDEGKSPSEKGSETEKEESPTKLRQLPKACLRKSEKTSGVPDPVMAKLEELGEMQHQMARRQATMHADLLHKYAELAEQVSATQGRLAQMASSRVLSEETQDADLR
ncbi:unnamed protein product [Effrenium voratum]|nr:unnamed protein product [Effrenium voratum]